jgi:hypothetical protein
MLSKKFQEELTEGIALIMTELLVPIKQGLSDLRSVAIRDQDRINPKRIVELESRQVPTATKTLKLIGAESH